MGIPAAPTAVFEINGGREEMKLCVGDSIRVANADQFREITAYLHDCGFCWEDGTSLLSRDSSMFVFAAYLRVENDKRIDWGYCDDGCHAYLIYDVLLQSSHDILKCGVRICVNNHEEYQQILSLLETHKWRWRSGHLPTDWSGDQYLRHPDTEEWPTGLSLGGDHKFGRCSARRTNISAKFIINANSKIHVDDAALASFL